MHNPQRALWKPCHSHSPDHSTSMHSKCIWTVLAFIWLGKSVKNKFKDTGQIVHFPMGLPIMASCDTAWNWTRMPVVTPLALRYSALDHCTTWEPHQISLVPGKLLWAASISRDPYIYAKHISIILTDQVNSGESWDPLLMSLVKSTSISVNEGEDTG